MDTRTLFQKISQRMSVDFEASAQIKHAESKGTARENILRDFLAERLPAPYGLISGEVVGHSPRYIHDNATWLCTTNSMA